MTNASQVDDRRGRQAARPAARVDVARALVPEYGRILAPVSDGLLAHLIREPLIREHLFDLSESREAGFELPSSGLQLRTALPSSEWVLMVGLRPPAAQFNV